MSTQEKIRKAGQEIIDLLIEKNESYGDSALRIAMDNEEPKLQPWQEEVLHTEGFYQTTT